VLSVLPGHSKSIIRCKLWHIKLAEDAHTCLSYTWGLETPTHVILINDKRFTVRENLDGLAAHLAAQFATPSDIATLIAINEEFAGTAREGNVKAMADLNLQFHEAIARIARAGSRMRALRSASTP